MKIQEAIKEKTVVHCATKSEANRIIGMMKDYSQIMYADFKSNIRWHTYKSETCYYLYSGTFCDCAYFKESKYTIIESTEIEDESPKTELESSEKVEEMEDIVNESILQEADRIVNGDRQMDYSDPVENFKHIARIASAILRKDLTASDCCTVMIAVKKARESYKHKRDNLVDDAGYTEILYRIKEDEAKNDTI